MMKLKFDFNRLKATKGKVGMLGGKTANTSDAYRPGMGSLGRCAHRGDIRSEYSLKGGIVGTRSRLRCVGEGEPGGVDDTVIAYQTDLHLCRLANPLPAFSKLRYVRHYTEHTLGASTREKERTYLVLSLFGVSKTSKLTGTWSLLPHPRTRP